jgi:hypothetical protein
MRFDPDSEYSRCGPSDALGPAIAALFLVGFLIFLVSIPQVGFTSSADLEDSIMIQINTIRGEHGLQPLVRVSKPLAIEYTCSLTTVTTNMTVTKDVLATSYPMLLDPDVKYVYINIKENLISELTIGVA